MKRILALVVLALAIGGASFTQTRVEFHLLPAVSTGPLDPSWSPDGRLIVFAMRGDIWTVPRDGGEAVALTEGPAYHSEPVFSPDGSKVALTMMDRDGSLDIGIVESGRVRRLTSDPEVDFSPEWSGDGESLYFVTRRAGNLDIYRLDLASGVESPVVATRRNDFQPVVSPDGGKLAYISAVDGRSGSGGIWVMPLPDGEPVLVHYEETSYRAKPVWSADGASLFYSTDQAGSNDIAVVPSAGGNRVRLTEDPLDEFDPAISPDGDTVAFVSNHRGPTALYTLSSLGGARQAWKHVPITSRSPLFETGRVRGVVRGPNGNVVPARLMLTASDGRAYTEDGGFHRMVPSTQTHFQHTSGSFEIEVPAGITTIEAMRGFEYLPASARVEVPAGGVVDVALDLERMAEPGATGWISGDMHVHDLHEGRFGLTQEGFFHQLVADDVHVANALIHMDGTKLMGRWSDLTGEPYDLSNGEHILRYSQEFRGSFGHVALVGVDAFIMPLIGGAANTPYAPDVLKTRHIDGVHAQGGIAGFVHPYNQPVETPEDAAAADIPVHVALGKGEFYDVVSIASREADSTLVYEKMLGSGFRIAATGGTDNFSDVWYDPSGGTARTYARIDGSLSFDSWIAAVRDRRTFATNGPLLFLDVAGSQPGDEIRDPASSLPVRVELSSITPVDRVEIVVNGEVAHMWAPEGEGPTFSFETKVEVPGSAWITARALGPPSRFVGDAHAFAYTSPIDVIRGGVRYQSSADARFLLESVDALWARVQARNTWHTDAQRDAYQSGIDEARAAYASVLLMDPENPGFAQPAPELSQVRLTTNEGDIVIELRRDWSPTGVDRFYNLVRAGYYDGVRFSRVREDFAQFGIQGDPEIARAWRDRVIPDDPVAESNTRGRVTFAMSTTPDSRTTQLFINKVDKTDLDDTGFAPVGEVVEGMDVVDALHAGYRESSGGGIRGGKQDPVFEGGNAYLETNYPELDFIIRARIVENREP